jgi:O-antigen/teichoic acid export membrane protein
LIKSIILSSRRYLSLLRFRPFDTTTEEGRTQERYRRAALTGLATIIAKALSLLTIIITVPLTLKYLGPERYGLWMTISSVILMLNFADFGIGNGLMNAVSDAYGKNDHHAIKHYVSSAFFILLGLAALFLVIFALLYHFIPWQKVFNVKSPQAVREAGPAMAAFAVCFALNIPLGVIQRVQWGFQEGFINSLWEGLGKVLGLLGVIGVIYLQAGLLWLIFAMNGMQILTLFFNGLLLFGRRRTWLLPRWRYFISESATRVMRIGLLFFTLQIGVALIFWSDNIIVAQVMGSETVAQYDVVRQLFSFPLIFMATLLNPLWPAYSEAIARGDTDWVRKTLYKSLILTLIIVGLPALVLALFGQKIIHVWVGRQIDPSIWLLIGFGIWSILTAAGSAVAMFLNGANIIRFQIIIVILTSISAFLAKIFFGRFIGLPGVVWGSIIAYCLFNLVPYLLFVPKYLDKKQLKSAFAD